MWVEADSNIPSGESLVRQLLFGTRFFEREFGIKNRILWLPDVFGYNAALPQILKKSDIDYFMTTKISRSQFNKIPYDTFMWKGIDGTEILIHFITTRDLTQELNPHFTTYNGYMCPEAVMGGWKRYQQKELNKDILVAFGYSDDCGGHTKEMLENHRRIEMGIPGCPRTQVDTVNHYFKRLESTLKNSTRVPKWVGELYLEYHRGTYTSMARNKRDNRKSEIMYLDAEMISSFVVDITREQYEKEALNKGWEVILCNQFHDILPGSAIKEVYEDSDREYKYVLSNGQKIINNSLELLSQHIELHQNSILLFNTLSFDRNDIVTVEIDFELSNFTILDEKGQEIPVQVIGKQGRKMFMFFVNNIPAKGYKTYEAVEKNVNHSVEMRVTDRCMENRYFILKLDEKGTFTSIFDKVNHRELLKENKRGNKILAYEDKPMGNDNWDIDIYYKEKVWEIDAVEKIEVIENGPVIGTIRIKKKFLDSIFIQEISIYNDVSRIDFDTFVDWKESDILLKATFPLDINADKATYEIQYGNVERPTHWNTSWDMARFEVCAQKWVDLLESGFGVSMLNDCKYGHDIKDSDMSLTLLTSGTYPNPA